jgi:hypothetical protein
MEFYLITRPEHYDIDPEILLKVCVMTSMKLTIGQDSVFKEFQKEIGDIPLILKAE